MVDFNQDDTMGNDSMLCALRNIGTSGQKGAVLNMLGPAYDLHGNLKNNDSVKNTPFLEPSLGEDNFDILNKSSTNSCKLYEELKRKHQVDLNNANQLKDIEDSDLQEHMVQARIQLAEYEKKLEQLPEIKELQNLDTDVRKLLSRLTTSLKSQQMLLQVSCDNIILQATHAQRLSNDEYPYGHQKNASLKSFDILGQKMIETGNNLTDIVNVFVAFNRDLTVARRSYEIIVNGLLKRVEHFETSYIKLQSLQEMQRNANKCK